jgi:hypothetical protein
MIPASQQGLSDYQARPGGTEPDRRGLKELVIKSIQLPLKHNKIAFKMPSTTLAVPSSKLRKGDKNHHQPGEFTKLKKFHLQHLENRETFLHSVPTQCLSYKISKIEHG